MATAEITLPWSYWRAKWDKEFEEGQAYRDERAAIHQQSSDTPPFEYHTPVVSHGGVPGSIVEPPMYLDGRLIIGWAQSGPVLDMADTE